LEAELAVSILHTTHLFLGLEFGAGCDIFYLLILLLIDLFSGLG